ncbi:SGNH/GDSL hydrolase family protein [Flavobacterium sp. NRK F7]|uniref:SGNH/GDSL hydrolase family protein n=1 Tax=Flavobacterium sp. NRK F7 TaxID=2954930 RepID=UPI00209125A1|nr:SGNH/GDSL hydrolase family protein [Flavobacterium sp. NRK F7]MCO6163768.1 SGNH/GDSL hydrolase family protein [Flavobacterium sp. NRK F7]
MNNLGFFFILFCTVFLNHSNQKTDALLNSTPKYSLLFIGNSLTYTNDLPKLVKEEAKEKGIKVAVEMLAYPNYAIEDHWNEGKVQKLIASKKYDYVIIQQGPSSQSEGKNMLLASGKKYSDICKLNNTQLCYFMVWPAKSNYHTFDKVIQNYTEAAIRNEAILLPVGSAWKSYIESTNTWDYYSEDAFHPSLKGSKVAAMVIINTLFHK